MIHVNLKLCTVVKGRIEESNLPYPEAKRLHHRKPFRSENWFRWLSSQVRLPKSCYSINSNIAYYRMILIFICQYDLIPLPVK